MKTLSIQKMDLRKAGCLIVAIMWSSLIPTFAQFGGGAGSSSGAAGGAGAGGAAGSPGGFNAGTGGLGAGGISDFGVGASADYKLSARDLVVVEMFGQNDVRTAQRLTSNGEIRLPLIGRISLDGLTVRDAELEIERLYRDGGFYVEPQIMLFVQQYSENFVSIFGQVRTPNPIPFPPETKSIGILQAITMAGGFTRIANTQRVQVSRTNENGVEERFVVDVQEILKARRPGAVREFQLLPGDLVFVPERTF